MIIGTDAALPRDLRAAFSRAGVSHVLSISGLHVALVAGAGYALFRWLLARSRRLLLTANVPKLAAALSIVPVLLYAGIAGSNVATLRSVLMIVVFVAAVIVDRERHLVVSLEAAAIVIPSNVTPRRGADERPRILTAHPAPAQTTFLICTPRNSGMCSLPGPASGSPVDAVPEPLA